MKWAMVRKALLEPERVGWGKAILGRSGGAMGKGGFGGGEQRKGAKGAKGRNGEARRYSCRQTMCCAGGLVLGAHGGGGSRSPAGEGACPTSRMRCGFAGGGIFGGADGLGVEVEGAGGAPGDIAEVAELGAAAAFFVAGRVC